jgi:hypothetical protein
MEVALEERSTGIFRGIPSIRVMAPPLAAGRYGQDNAKHAVAFQACLT